MGFVAQRLILPGAAGLAIAAFATLQADRDGAPETALLGLLAFVALAALAALPGASGPRRLAAVSAVALTLALPAGSARGFIVTALLAAALAAGIEAATRRSEPGVLATGVWIPAAVAFQALAHPRLLPPATDGGTALLALVLDWLLLPAACGGAAAGLAARRGRATAAVAAGLVFAIGGGWTWIGAAALVVLALLGRTRRGLAPVRRVAAVGAGLGLAAVLATTIAAGYPWLSPSPARSALAALATLPYRTEALLVEPVVLSAARPEWHLTPEPGAARAVLIDTHLVGARHLPVGTPVAIFGVHRSDGEPLRRELRVGEETADWSAAADPAARPARVHRLAGDGRTFAGRWRTRIELPGGAKITQLTLERLAAAPDDLEVVLWWVGRER